ncbi:hypothetical protein BKA70DRAFT_1473237 [Coprinopsis sp. MPI-PUGE-AT-0042]|nr:hypothetical protein BKA70DRAFT_1473237 [Coprinopsis sp. MPI-PUGE-AT-0042]
MPKDAVYEYSKIIALLLESALPFTLIGIAGAVSTAFRNSETGAPNAGLASKLFFTAAWYNALALRPQFIIYRIISGLTWAYNPSNSASLDAAVSQPIRFANHPTLSSRSSARSVWRTTIIWSHRRILKWVPLVLYVVYFGICIASSWFRFSAVKSLIEDATTYMQRSDRDRWTTAYLETIDRTQSIFQVWCGTEFAMSAAVNVATTTLICARLIMVQRKMKRVASESSMFRSALPYDQVLTLIVASALPFTLVSLTGATMAAFLDPSSSASTKALNAFPLVMIVWTNALALVPQFIVFHILSGTIWTTGPTTHITRPVSQPLLFAEDPIVSLITAYSIDGEEFGSDQTSSSVSLPGGVRSRARPPSGGLSVSPVGGLPQRSSISA